MKLSTKYGLVRCGEDQAGATVIEYTAPTITSAFKLDSTAINSRVGAKAQRHHNGNDGVQQNHIEADNENRQLAVFDAISKEYKDSEVNLKTRYLKLPQCDGNSQQFVSQGKDWQGANWSSQSDGKDSFGMKANVMPLLIAETIDNVDCETVRWWIQWEIPVITLTGKGKKTGWTPQKVVEDFGDELRALYQNRNGN